MEGLVDVDETEEFEKVLDVNLDSLLLLLSEAELSCSSFSEDDGFVSEEESVSYWSEEVTNGGKVIVFGKECTVNIQESADTASSRTNSQFNHAISMPVPTNTRLQYAVAFTILTGI